MEYKDNVPNKPIEEYTEEDMKEMFLGMFFFVAENRPEWLQEAINLRKKRVGCKER